MLHLILKVEQMENKKIYILNSPILTAYGRYTFKPVSLEEAKTLLFSLNKFVSAVGHASTAQFLSRLLGVHVPAQRVRVEMQPGDIAVVFRLLERLPEGKVLSEEELQQIPYQLGLLRREE